MTIGGYALARRTGEVFSDSLESFGDVIPLTTSDLGLSNDGEQQLPVVGVGPGGRHVDGQLIVVKSVGIV